MIHAHPKQWSFTLFFRGKVNSFRISSPNIRTHPTIEILREILLLFRLAVVQHQAEAVALVSRTLLGAVGDVAAIGRIERRRVAGGSVGAAVLGLGQNLAGRGVRRSVNRDDTQSVVGGSGLVLVMIRGVANLVPIGREGIV